MSQASAANANNDSVLVIKPKKGWQILNIAELKEYRDLFFFMVWREIKVMYAQTVLGFSWALIQPLIQILIFTVIFGNVAKVSSEGIPYFLFSTAAVIPWTYMSQGMTESSQSLVAQQNMLGKVYFPRLIYPITPVLARLLDFGISMLLILVVCIYYRVMPTWKLLLLPLFILQMVAVTAGIGMWLSAMAIRFRDVKHAMPFVVRMLIYSAPIVYSASTIPGTYRIIYSLNPIVGVIEGFRASVLGLELEWVYLVPGFITSVLLFLGGAYYFKRMDRVFVDVI